jgi:type II secretory pathway pseudopilin PulG
VKEGEDAGVSLTEALVVAAVIATLSTLTAPLVARSRDAGRAWHATAYFAARFREMHHRAITGGASVGLVFDQIDGRWTFRVCRDRNGNGIRRAEIKAGVDVCPEGPHDIASILPGSRIAVLAGIPGPEGTASPTDAVKFGASDIASFSSAGSCTAGSIYLQSLDGTQYAIRVLGINGRTRMLRYDPIQKKWTEV